MILQFEADISDQILHLKLWLFAHWSYKISQYSPVDF